MNAGRESVAETLATNENQNVVLTLLRTPHTHTHSPRTYDLDTAELERHYKSLQAVLHPDKHSAAGAAATAAADAASAAVNTAYATLRCPLARAAYMVRECGSRREGVNTDARKTKQKPTHQPSHTPPQLDGLTDPAEAEADTLTDVALLDEVMEAREEVDAAERGAPELEGLRETAAARADAVATEVGAALAAGDEAAARAAVTRLRYATRLLQAVVDKM